MRKKGRNPVRMAGDDLSRALVRDSILGVVETQIKQNNPPAARKTLDRLMAAGHSRDEAMELIAYALIQEMWMVGREGKAHDPDRYRQLLDDLE